MLFFIYQKRNQDMEITDESRTLSAIVEPQESMQEDTTEVEGMQTFMEQMNTDNKASFEGMLATVQSFKI
jgi:hypothetical protein